LTSAKVVQTVFHEYNKCFKW